MIKIIQDMDFVGVLLPDKIDLGMGRRNSKKDLEAMDKGEDVMAHVIDIISIHEKNRLENVDRNVEHDFYFFEMIKIFLLSQKDISLLR